MPHGNLQEGIYAYCNTNDLYCKRSRARIGNHRADQLLRRRWRQFAHAAAEYTVTRRGRMKEIWEGGAVRTVFVRILRTGRPGSATCTRYCRSTPVTRYGTCRQITGFPQEYPYTDRMERARSSMTGPISSTGASMQRFDPWVSAILIMSGGAVPNLTDPCRRIPVFSIQATTPVTGVMGD